MAFPHPSDSHKMPRLTTRLTAPVTGNLARQAALLLLLTAALIGFFLILEFLGNLLSDGPQDILAENPSDQETFGLPNGVRLLQYAVLAVSAVFALAALSVAVGGRWDRTALRPSPSLALGVVAAAALVAAGCYLAFSGVLGQELSYDEHTVYRSFLQSGGLALAAAIFLTLAIAGVVSRYLLPLILAVWLVLPWPLASLTPALSTASTCSNAPINWRRPANTPLSLRTTSEQSPMQPTRRWSWLANCRRNPPWNPKWSLSLAPLLSPMLLQSRVQLYCRPTPRNLSRCSGLWEPPTRATSAPHRRCL